MGDVRVTCLPGCHFVVPHPSGLPGVVSLLVTGGMVVSVPAERAARLWEARLILNPATGEPPAPPKPLQDGTRLFTGNAIAAPTLDVIDLRGPNIPPPASRERIMAHGGLSRPAAAVTTYGDDPAPMVKVRGADDSDWPNF